MKQASQGLVKKPVFFALLCVVSIFACFILAPLGGFTGWIFGGGATYFLFLSIYSMIVRPGKRFTRPRYDPRQKEMKAYISFHTYILLSLFAFTILIVLGLLLFVI